MVRALLSLAALLIAVAPAPAEARRGDRDDAIQICRREMSDRFGGAEVRVEEVHRASRRGDRISVHARMRVRRVGSDVRRDVDCAVDFSARRPRVVAFSTDRDSWGHGWGRPDAGDDQRAARICWREADAAGYRIRQVLSVQPAARGGRLVVLHAGRNDRVECLYRKGVRDLRYRRR